MSSFRRHQVRTPSGLAAGAAVLFLAACSGSPSSASSSAATLPQTLVFSPIGLQVPAMKGLSEGVTGYGKSKGWEVIVQDPNLDPTKQVQQVTEVLDSGRAGAVWVIAIAPKSMSDVLKAAQSKGMPILINGAPADYGFDGTQPGITFDTIDYAAGGTAVGEQLGQCINEKLNGKAQVVYGESAAGTAGKQESDKSFVAALKATAPGATVVQNWTAVDRAGSQTDVGNILQGKPEVTAVAAVNDEGALGALGAFKAAGKDLPCLVEFGGNDEVLGLVKDGTIFASVALQFGDDMTQSFDALIAMQADPTAVGETLTVPQKVITADS